MADDLVPSRPVIPVEVRPDFAQIREEVWMPEDFPQDNPDLCQICGKVVELPVCASHYDAVQADNHQLTNQLGEIAKVLDLIVRATLASYKKV